MTIGTIKNYKTDNGGNALKFVNGETDIQITSYSVFDGVTMVYSDIHAPRYDHNIGNTSKSIIEIDYCFEGRLECQIKDSYFYLVPGDVCVHLHGRGMKEEVFPTKHYHGITLRIDTDKISMLSKNVPVMENIDIPDIFGKFRLEENIFYVFRQVQDINHIFYELYHVPDSIQIQYRKIKTFELLLILKSLYVHERAQEQNCFTASQVSLAKEVCAHLSSHLENRLTISALADIFNSSEYQIKNSFRSVYGVSVSIFLRSQRMQKAAKLLKDTDLPILEIAGMVGYDNGSKFAEVFRKSMGQTPLQYRKAFLHR